MKTVRIRKTVLAIALPIMLLLTATSFAAQKQAAEFALRDQDRVVFFGDSITEQRIYTNYIEDYVLTRYPERCVTFINSGWGGDQVSSNDCAPCAGVGALARINRDVIAHKPTVVTLLFGMNDGRYQDFDPAILKVYEDGMARIIHELKAQTTARIYVMTPTVYDGTRHTPWSKTTRYNEVLDRYSDAAKQLAAREKLSLIDLHTATTEALLRAKQLDAAYTFAADGVHPNADGHAVMAAEILRAWGAPVKGEALTRRAKIEVNRELSLRIAALLPWPVPLPSERMQGVEPQIRQMGDDTLRVIGLSEGAYTISVDGSMPESITSAQLRSGVPFGFLSAQAMQESRALDELVRLRTFMYQTRWRQIELQSPGFDRAMPTLADFDSLIEQVFEQERVLAKPHEYHVVVKRK